VAEPFVTVLVLAAGGSRRFGGPKQLLPYGGATLLDHAIGVARASGADQVVVALGGAVDRVRAQIALDGVDVAVNPRFGEGCSSSIAAAMDAVNPRCDVLVLLLGDQPGVTPQTMRSLVAGRGGAALAVCRYADGRGHPFAFGRESFAGLRALHGDKAVWRLLERAGDAVAEVAVPGPVPRDVDTPEDYAAVLAGA